MADFRFIHTADIHLDSPLRGLARREDATAETIRTASREAFDNLISCAIDERVDFLVIAGDLYDGDWRAFQTGLYFSAQMGRLTKADIPAFVLHGNHDAESTITKRLTLPENVRVFSARKAETFPLDELGVVLHGQSFKQRDVTENLVLTYPEPVPGKFNIGVLHTGLGGMSGHANYAPCTINDLVAKGYDYWALGHIHEGEVLHEHPHVVFPGNLQGRHIRETGAKGAQLVTVEDGEIATMEFVHADVVRWSMISLPIGECARIDDVFECMREGLEQAVEAEADGRLLACRVELTGRTDIHGELTIATERLLAEAQSIALGLGTDVAWIERVVVATEPALDEATLAAREDALGELQRMLHSAGQDNALLEDLKADIGKLLHGLPAELRAEPEDAVLQAALNGDYAKVISDATAYLNARLAAKDE